MALWHLIILAFSGTSDWRYLIGFNTVGFFAVALTSAFAAMTLAGAETDRTVRTLALAAAAGFAALGLFSLADAYATFTDERFDNALVRQARMALPAVTSTLLATAFFRASARRRSLPPLAMLTAAVLLTIAGLAWRAYMESAPALEPWRWNVMSALGAIELIAFGAFLHTVRARLTPVGTGTWADAGEGLATYAGAVKARLVTAVIVAPLAVMLGRSGDPSAAQVLVVLAGLVSLATGAFLIAGLVRFARMPADGSPAAIGAALIGVGFLFDVWTLVLAVRLDAHPSELATQGPVAEAGAQICGAVALLGVLAAIRTAARALKAPELVDRARAVAWLLAGGGLALAALKLVSTQLHAEPLVLLALPVVIGLLVGLARFFGLLTDAVRLLQPTHEPAAASSAQSDA